MGARATLKDCSLPPPWRDEARGGGGPGQGFVVEIIEYA